MHAKIAKYGNSLTVRLPASVARELNLREGDEVNLRLVEGGIILECPTRSRLAARLATVKSSETEEWSTVLVGREL